VYPGEPVLMMIAYICVKGHDEGESRVSPGFGEAP